MTAPAATIPHVVDHAAAWRGDHPAVVEDGGRITYSELALKMRHAAAAFVRAGLVPGDRVAIWVHNGIDWIIACLGAQAAGGVIVPLNTRFKGGEAHYILQRSGARFLVHSARFLGADYAAMIEGLDTPALERLISVPTDEAPEAGWAGFLAEGAADEAAMAEAERRLAALSPDAISDIMFTSGTTGAPKGVVTNHGQNVRVYREWVAATGINADDRYGMIYPFFHCSGYKSGWLVSAIAGSTLYPQTTLDVKKLAAIVTSEKISVLPGPPTLFQTMLESPEGRAGQFSSLRFTVTGATTVAPALIEAMRDDLGLKAIYAGYGLTETCGTVTMTQASDGPEVVVRSPGRAIGGIEMATMDETGRLLGPDEEGEIVVRGYNVMLGYLDDPAATAETIDADGWLHTGDFGSVDENGYLVITGRKKDIYIVGGFNCYPAEIENMMLAHPAIAEVSVIGVPDVRMGEVGKAFVRRDPEGGPIDEPALIAWCRDQMANFKVPRAIVFVDDFPRTPTGKVQKFRLAAGEFG